MRICLHHFHLIGHHLQARNLLALDRPLQYHQNTSSPPKSRQEHHPLELHGAARPILQRWHKRGYCRQAKPVLSVPVPCVHARILACSAPVYFWAPLLSLRWLKPRSSSDVALYCRPPCQQFHLCPTGTLICCPEVHC